MDDIFSYKDYLKKYNKNNKYDIKELVFKKLGIDGSKFKINSLDDISSLQFKFVRNFPFNDMDVLTDDYKIYDLDYIVRTLFFDCNGSFCPILNLVFGIVLYQISKEDNDCGITNIERIMTNKSNNKAISKQYEYLSAHAANGITFKGKDYYVEVSLLERIPYPIEMGGIDGTPFFNTEKLTRIVKSDDQIGQFIYQEKKPGSEDYISFFQFSKNKSTYKEFLERTKIGRKEFKLDLKLYIKFDNGSYFYDQSFGPLFIILYSSGIYTKINIIDDDHLDQLMLVYLGIKSFSEKQRYTNANTKNMKSKL